MKSIDENSGETRKLRYKRPCMKDTIKGHQRNEHNLAGDVVKAYNKDLGNGTRNECDVDHNFPVPAACDFKETTDTQYSA